MDAAAAAREAEVNEVLAGRGCGEFVRTSMQSMKGAFSRLLRSLASAAGTRTTRSFSQLNGKQTETPCQSQSRTEK